MFGRESTLEELASGATNINLIGLPGVGKTRVLRALSLRRSQVEGSGSEASDILFIDLAGQTRDVALSIAGVASQLSPAETTSDFELLVLDHAEGCRDALAHELPIIREAHPDTRLIIASRVDLMLPGFELHRLMGLAEEDARALFEASAPGWLDRDPGASAELLDLLDGNPLGIELAARRARLLSPGQLLERLLDHVDVLRHPQLGASMNALIEETWNDSSEEARVLAARIGVFCSPVTLEALEEVLTDETFGSDALLDALDDLDARGALRVEDGHFSVSSLILEHARAIDPPTDKLYRAHARWISARCDSALQDPSGQTPKVLSTAYFKEMLAAWGRIRQDRNARTNYPGLCRMVDALSKLRTSTMTRSHYRATSSTSSALTVELPKALESAEQMWRAGQKEDAHALLARASLAPEQDRALAAKLYAALARAQRELGLPWEAAASFEQASMLYDGLGQSERSRRYSLRQADMLSMARAHALAADVLESLLATTPSNNTRERTELTLALAEQLLDVDAERAVALHATARSASGSSTTSLLDADIQAIQGRYKDALETLDELDATSQSHALRRIELVLLLGRGEQALSLLDSMQLVGLEEEREILEGLAHWQRGRSEQAIAAWSKRRSSLIATWLERAALDHPLAIPPRGSSSSSIYAVIEGWRQDRLGEQDLSYRPGEMSAGWFQRVLSWCPRDRQPPVPLDVLDQTATENAWLVRADGYGFRAPGEPFISLRGKDTLARVLSALAGAHRASPEDALAFSEAFARGWPEQARTEQESARNRLRVAIRRLRDAGLRGLILTDPDGYMLDPEQEVVVYDATSREE